MDSMARAITTADTAPDGRQANDGRTRHLNDDACWNAVVGHDKDADGLFFYGVR